MQTSHEENCMYFFLLVNYCDFALQESKHWSVFSFVLVFFSVGQAKILMKCLQMSLTSRVCFGVGMMWIERFFIAIRMVGWKNFGIYDMKFKISSSKRNSLKVNIERLGFVFLSLFIGHWCSLGSNITPHHRHYATLLKNYAIYIISLKKVLKVRFLFSNFSVESLILSLLYQSPK